jgi:hypothetical protein
MTEEELKAQLDLADARLKVISGESITAAEYRQLIASLRAGREAKAAALGEASKARARARKANQPKLTTEDLRAMFNLSATAED